MTKQPPVNRTISSRSWNVLSSSQQQTERLGQALGQALQAGQTIALYGPLGAGKTALVRGIALGLGASPTAVTSPTFVVIHEYQGHLPMAHMDWYRIGSLHELESTGLTEYFAGQTVTVIEWAERGLPLLPQDRIDITLHHRTAFSRMIQLKTTGSTSHTALSRARTTYCTSQRQRSNRKGTITS